jgi:glycosyltransferase involved in cell wall biosynthesis
LKILCVIDSLGSGGAQRQLVNLAIGFKEKGHNVSFLVYHDEDFFEYLLLENAISIEKIIEQSYIKRLFKIRRYIRNNHFDSVLSFLDSPNLICQLSGFPRRKWKLVVGERSADPAILTSVKLILYKWFHLFADHIVANSEVNMDLVLKVNKLLSRKKCHVIYNMIDLHYLNSQEVELIQGAKFNLTIVSSIGLVKNLDGLIEAVALLPQLYKERLQIRWYGRQGSPEYMNSILEKIRLLNLTEIFTFYPQTRCIKERMMEATAIGLFSHHEGFPNAICEGMALSKPVMATKISDLDRILQFAVDLPDSRRADKISEYLKFYMDKDTVALRREGSGNRKIAEKLFSRGRIIESYLLILGA